MRFLLQLLLLTGLTAAAQEINKPSATYALVIGISTYETNLIPALQFADRDAQMFANYLQTKSGGSVPAANIQLLQNENASCGAIIDAMYQLQERASKNDLVYFYFSGHGDVENKLFDNPGYLLGYNTPDHNYTNHAIQISFVNEWANTLSIINNCRVVLITDACHSGKLAGDTVQGRQWIGQQLNGNKPKRNLIRIASCKPNELSNEGKSWGDGRGVFSYYMLQGLYGFADADKNTNVTKEELDNYLSKALQNDPVLQAQKTPQSPVLIGNGSATLAIVDEAMFDTMNKPGTQKIPQNTFGPLQKSNFEKLLDCFANALAELDIDELFGGISADSLSGRAIVQTLIQNNNLPIEDRVFDSLKMLITSLNDPNSAKRFNQKLAATVSDMGQKIIGIYLHGDQAELKKRVDYYKANKTYSGYVTLYRLARRLVANEPVLQHRLSVDGNYFAGLVQRLKLPTVPDNRKLLDSAFKNQFAALALEPYQAAYLHNEVGYLYIVKGMYDSALYHYIRACNISPSWAIPWIGLMASYNNKKDIANARAAAAQAMRLQPGIDSLDIFMESEGVTEELAQNWLKAEELQTRSTDQNKIHYFPYEQLGMIYTATTRYRMADSLFNEAALRKKNFYFKQNWVPPPPPPLPNKIPKLPKYVETCAMPTINDATQNIYLLLFAGASPNDSSTPKEEHYLKRAVGFTDDLFLLNHYYGRLLYQKGDFLLAEKYLRNAALQFQDYGAFTKYVSTLQPFSPKGMDSACFTARLLNLYYDVDEDYTMLADIYEHLQYFEEAEFYYRASINKKNLSSYRPLAEMLVANTHYEKAELVWADYLNLVFATFNYELMEDATKSLEDFYTKMLGIFPESSLWHKKAVEYWYLKLMKRSNGYGYLKYNPAFPYCINLLQQTLDMAKTDEDLDLVALNMMMNNLYNAAGEKGMAAKFYQAAIIESAHGNASLRAGLADELLESHFYGDAFAQLDTLAVQDRLLTDHYLMYIRMAINNGNFEKAEAMLLKAKKQLPLLKDSVAALSAMLYFVQGNAIKASSYYTDSVQQAIPPGEKFYAVACLKSLAGNKKEALFWLQKALKNGFAYGFVLQNDPAWSKLKTGREWQTLTTAYRYKKYQDDDSGAQ